MTETNNVPIVSVIVLNWNGKNLLEDCLSSLSNQTFKSYEVILVDNGSTDDSVDFVSKKFPSIRIIRLESNYGFCKGNNVGIESANGEFIVLLNNDTEVETDWLEELYIHIIKDPSIAACDSKVLFFNERNKIWSAGVNYSIAGSVVARGYLQENNGHFNTTKEVFAAVACAAIFRKSVLDEIGLLDEDFFAGYEDIDWSFRARVHGYRIINAPSARVYHKVSATQVKNSNMYVLNGQRNVSLVFIKNMPSWLLFKYLIFHLFYTIGSFFYFAKIGKARAFLLAKLDIVRNLKSLFHKRQAVQSRRKASIDDIERMLDRNWINPKIHKFLIEK